MRFENPVRARLPRAEERKAFGAILREVAPRIMLVDRAFDDAGRAGQTPAL
jgi:hypothetical protein